MLSYLSPVRPLIQSVVPYTDSLHCIARNGAKVWAQKTVIALPAYLRPSFHTRASMPYFSSVADLHVAKATEKEMALCTALHLAPGQMQRSVHRRVPGQMPVSPRFLERAAESRISSGPRPQGAFLLPYHLCPLLMKESLFAVAPGRVAV